MLVFQPAFNVTLLKGIFVGMYIVYMNYYTQLCKYCIMENWHEIKHS